MKRTPPCLTLAIALIGTSAWSWAAENDEQLPTIKVKAHARQPLTFKTTKLDKKTIEKSNAVDLKTLLKDIPGVEVPDVQGTRQGNDSVNIRGLSGNRVGMSIDGINLPESNENKNNTGQSVIFGRGNFIEPSALRSVAVDKTARGFGLGGALEMQTLTPDDVLNGEAQGGYIASTYNSIDNSKMFTGAAALSRGDWRGMILGTWRKGQETDNRGNVGGTGKDRTKPDPTNHNNRYFLTKHEYDINEYHTLNLTAEHLSRNQSMLGLSNLSSTVTGYNAQDDNKRTRLSLGHHYHNDAGQIQDIQTQVYWQRTETHSDTLQQGTNFNNKNYWPKGFRHQVFNNNDKVWGLSTKWLSHFDGEKLSQMWRYGAEVAHHDLTSDWQSNYHYLKSKPTADSKSIRATLFIDGDLSFSQFAISPGLSAHYYRFNPNNKGYEPGTTSILGEVKKQSDSAVTPRLGLSWKIAPLFQPYMQYSRGFNAPSSQQLSSTFNSGHYSMWGNPDLKPETVNNFELGLRGKNEVLEYSISGYDNHYRNFIDYIDITEKANLLDSEPYGCRPGRPCPPRRQNFTYQYHNFSKAHIYGGEAHAAWKFMPNWLLSGWIAYTKGSINDDDGKAPLNSISPMKTKLGLAYGQEQWGANIDFTYAAAKKDKDLKKVKLNPSKSYTLVDLGAYWKPNKHLSVNAGVNNVFNQRYWNWGDIAYLVPNINNDTNSGQSDGSVSMTKDNVNRFTAPGRNFNIGIRYTF